MQPDWSLVFFAEFGIGHDHGCIFTRVQIRTRAWLAASARLGVLYAQCLVWLADKASKEKRPLWKVRPKLHRFVCKTVLRDTRLNCRFVSCWTEEDNVGKTCSVACGAVHASTLSKRLLQRFLLRLNGPTFARVRKQPRSSCALRVWGRRFSSQRSFVFFSD